MTTPIAKPPSYRYQMPELIEHLAGKGIKKSAKTITRWMEEKRFRYYKIGGSKYFDLYQLDRWIEVTCHRGMETF